MKKYGPTDKPATFDKAALTKVKNPNQKKPAAKVEVPAPEIPPPPPYNPMKAFGEWAATVTTELDKNGFGYQPDSKVIKKVYGAQIWKNMSTVESNRKVVFKKTVLKGDWPPPDEWTYVAGGFDASTVKSSDDPEEGDRLVLEWELLPGEEYGFVLKKSSRGWVG